MLLLIAVILAASLFGAPQDVPRGPSRRPDFGIDFISTHLYALI